ncbi:hypothetical protein L202_05211 [Cryptococcus amylolentus CBS 6039]|uniref:Uncharacterized protein n=2 Tax=Cryptococcus amylolentus TaxID=104669 RepID=A0A1E3HJM6_9TREE|nr:hypothetical protein L202_05211 [Cryptococcus amylolentus CBS 6039]ODN76549.1 hypothetical protein L202_05211 [Cryptococcus amylolentus CBS 6039]ODO04537.1 hypothetical protein I350_05141 [Cryptococcus amylolentus CBS 6273]
MSTKTAPLTTLEHLPSEVQILIFEHLQHSAEKPLLAKLILLSRQLHTDLIPILYERVSITSKNASLFFSGLEHDAEMFEEEKARWVDMPWEERASPAARRMYLLSLVQTVSIHDLDALLACCSAIATLERLLLPFPQVDHLPGPRLLLFSGLKTVGDITTPNGLHLPRSFFTSIRHVPSLPNEIINSAGHFARPASIISLTGTQEVLTFHHDVHKLLFDILRFIWPAALILHNTDLSDLYFIQTNCLTWVYVKMQKTKARGNKHEQQLMDLLGWCSYEDREMKVLVDNYSFERGEGSKEVVARMMKMLKQIWPSHHTKLFLAERGCTVADKLVPGHEEEPETTKPARPVHKAARRTRSVNTSPRTLEKKATSRGRPSLDQVAEAQEAGQSAYPTPNKTPRRIVVHDELPSAEGSRKNDGLILLLRVMEEAEESDSDRDSDRGDGASPPPVPMLRAGYQHEGFLI